MRHKQKQDHRLSTEGNKRSPRPVGAGVLGGLTAGSGRRSSIDDSYCMC